MGDAIYGMSGEFPEAKGGMYFNKRLLKEAGIDPQEIYDLQENMEWTWERIGIIIHSGAHGEAHKSEIVFHIFHLSCSVSLVSHEAGFTVYISGNPVIPCAWT